MWTLRVSYDQSAPVFEIVISELQARNDSDFNQINRNRVKYSEKLKLQAQNDSDFNQIEIE